MVLEGWSLKTLESAKIKVIDGDRGKEYPKAGDFLETGYCLFLSAKNVTKAGFLFEELQFINEDKDKKLRKGRVERGNIVLTTRGSVGQFAYFDNSVRYDVMRINSGMVVIDATQSELLPEFFYALCRSYLVAKQIEAASFGSAQPQLTVGIIKGIKLPIPSLPEQKKIAKILSTWDQAIVTTEQLLACSQQQKKALMQQLLTGKKRLLDKNGLRFSGEWKSYKFGNLFKERVEIGHDYLPLLSITAEDGVVYQIDTGRKNTSNEDKSKYRRICVNDIGYNTMRMWQGRSSLSDKEGIVSPAYTIVTPTEKVCPIFAAYLFKLPELIHVFYRHSQGLVSDTWNLKFNHFKIISWKFPNIEEQQKIAAVLSTADQEITVLQQKIAALKQEKKALMQQLLTGKRRVKTKDKEVS